MRRHDRTRGQSSLELAILFSVVIIAFVALQYYVRNAAAGRLKSSADSVSQTQFDPLKGNTNLVVNRVSVDKTYAGVPYNGTTPLPVQQMAFNGTPLAGYAGRTESLTNKDDTNRQDR